MAGSAMAIFSNFNPGGQKVKISHFLHSGPHFSCNFMIFTYVPLAHHIFQLKKKIEVISKIVDFYILSETRMLRNDYFHVFF